MLEIWMKIYKISIIQYYIRNSTKTKIFLYYVILKYHTINELSIGNCARCYTWVYFKGIAIKLRMLRLVIFRISVTRQKRDPYPLLFSWTYVSFRLLIPSQSRKHFAKHYLNFCIKNIHKRL